MQILNENKKEISLSNFTHLKKGGDSQCGNAAIDISDQVFKIQVASCDRHRLGHSHLIQSAHCSKPKGWAW